MKNLYLHIGAHKTASSLLQMALKENDANLQKNGLGVIYRQEFIDSALNAEVSKINKTGELPKELNFDAFDNLINSKKSKHKLITNEDLFSTLSLSDFYQNIKHSLRYIKMLAKSYNIVVIFYGRKQSDYIESKYTQFIHLGRSVTFDEFIGDEIPKHLSWLKVAEDIEDIIGIDNLHVKPFECIKDVGDTNFFLDFIATLGVDNTGIYYPDGMSSRRGANRSYSEKAISIANLVNPLLDAQEKKLLRRFLQVNFSTATHPRAKLLTENSRSKIDNYYKDSNKELFEKYIQCNYGTSDHYNYY